MEVTYFTDVSLPFQTSVCLHWILSTINNLQIKVLTFIIVVYSGGYVGQNACNKRLQYCKRQEYIPISLPLKENKLIYVNKISCYSVREMRFKCGIANIYFWIVILGDKCLTVVKTFSQTVSLYHEAVQPFQRSIGTAIPEVQ